jgi:hypothetical protein
MFKPRAGLTQLGCFQPRSCRCGYPLAYRKIPSGLLRGPACQRVLGRSHARIRLCPVVWLNEAITFLHAVKLHFARHHRVRPFVRLTTQLTRTKPFRGVKMLEGSDRVPSNHPRYTLGHTAFMLPLLTFSLRQVLSPANALQGLLFCIIQRSSRALSLARRHALARNSAWVSSVRLSSS